MSHHRTYEETYKDAPHSKGKVSDENKEPAEQPLNPKFGDHIKERQVHEHKREGK